MDVRRLLIIPCLCLLAGPAPGQPAVKLAPYTVTALPPLPQETAFRADFVNLSAPAALPDLRMDEALGVIPGASLYRRASSRSAHPTTQGLSLRQVGGNGAGRALVLLDGVPQNDPFGGWVNWSQMPPGLVRAATIREGGGSPLFGPMALTGVVELQTAGDRPLDELLAGGGQGLGYGYLRLEPSFTDNPALRDSSLLLFGGASRDDGYYVRPADLRGPVDAKAGADSDVLRGRWTQRLGDTRFSLSAGWFDERRTNDSRGEHNATSGRDVSLRAVSGDAGAGWEALAYWQGREFSSDFTSVNDDRTAETPVVDQYDVPGEAAGGALRLRFTAADAVPVEVGVEGRRVMGSNNELGRNLGDGFTRDRHMGGVAATWGGYTVAGADAGPLRLSGALRVDHWQNDDGYYTEYDRATGAATAVEHYAGRGGNVVTGRLGGEWRISDALGLTGAVYRSFRPPTLNELYRPYRVGDVITIQNPALDPETLDGVDLGARWAASSRLHGSVTLYAVRLAGAISNVTIGHGPGTFDPGGYVPAGGVLLQRQNVGAIETLGMETATHWRARGTLELTVRTLVTRSRVADAGPLTGRRPAQTPSWSGSLEAAWEATAFVHVHADFRVAGRAWEDDQNTLPLASYGLLDAGIAWDVSPRLALSLDARNLLNNRIQTGRDPDGTPSIGEPRTLWAGVRYAF